MLTLTNDAVSAIHTLTTRPDLPDQTGLRIASLAGEDGSASFAVSVAAAPQPQDQVLEAEGARVFLDSEAAAALDEKALDAEVDEQGQVRFQLADMSP